MKSKFIVILSFLLLPFFVSCASVPDEVVNDMNNYNQGSSINSDTCLSYINDSDIADDIENALEKQYNQFSLSKDICIEYPKDIQELSFQYVDGFEVNYNDVLKMFFSQSEIDSQNIDNNSDSPDRMFFNESDKKYGCVSNNGFIAMLKPDAFDISFSYNEPNVRIYHIDRNESVDDYYMLKNGECSIHEAVDFINNWLQTEYKKFVPYYDYKVKTVIVREHDNHYLYEFTIEILYNGIPLDELTREATEDKENETMYMSYTSNKIEIQMININQIDSFTNGTGILKPINKSSVPNYISLSSALQYCEQKFTDFKSVTIDDIGIKYLTSPIYDYVGEKQIDEKGNAFYVNKHHMTLE